MILSCLSKIINFLINTHPPPAESKAGTHQFLPLSQWPIPTHQGNLQLLVTDREKVSQSQHPCNLKPSWRCLLMHQLYSCSPAGQVPRKKKLLMGNLTQLAVRSNQDCMQDDALPLSPSSLSKSISLWKAGAFPEPKPDAWSTLLGVIKPTSPEALTRLSPMNRAKLYSSLELCPIQNKACLKWFHYKSWKTSTTAKPTKLTKYT